MKSAVMNLNTLHAAFKVARLATKHTEPGQHTETVSRENVPGREAGQRHNHVLRQVALIQLKQLAVPILSILHAVSQAALLARKLTVLGLHTETVSKEKGLDIELGQPYKPILILVAIAQPQKLTEQNMSTLHAALLVVLLVPRITVHGDHGDLVAKESKLELEHGLRLRHV